MIERKVQEIFSVYDRMGEGFGSASISSDKEAVVLRMGARNCLMPDVAKDLGTLLIKLADEISKSKPKRKNRK